MCNQSENELSIQLAIMDLYCEDLKKQFEIGYKETDCFSILLPANALNQLKLDCKLDLSRFSSELWRLLFHAPTRGGLYQSVIHFVSLFGRKTSDLLCKLQLNSSANVRCLLTLALKEYNRLLSVMNPYVVMDKLSDMDATYAVVLNDIAMKSDLRNLSRTSLIKSILQCLPIFGLDSWWNLLYAIQCQGSDGEEYVNSVVPKFSYFYERLRMERDEVDSSGPVFVVDKNCSISDAVLQSASKNCCFKVNLQYDLFPSLSKANCDSARGEPLFLRSYQEELAEPARNGENTIVCAPTGCGKTLVAVDIIQKHLIEGYSRKESRKVCFLVTNTTFLEQQTNVLKKYLEYRWIVKGISGATVSSTPVADIIRSVDVIVLTPQLLINTLEMKDPLNFSSFFSLSTFTLLVFDEAHHTNDNHPYNVIMDKYHCLKERGLIISGVHPFQILGMTASLGIGKAKTAEDAVKHIISICANMDISVISRVRKNVGDLCKFSGMTSDSIKLVETAHKHHELFHIFNDYMKKLEEILLDTKFSESSIHTPEGTSFLLDANPLQPPKAGRDSQAYEGWIANLQTYIIPCSYISEDDRLRAISCLQCLKTAHDSLKLLTNFPCNVVRQYVQREFWELHKAVTKDIELILRDWLASIALASECRNDLYDELISELLSEFRKCDGRVLIFVKTRLYALELSDCINNDVALNKLGVTCAVITGVNAATNDGGLSLNEQRQILKSFAEGGLKVVCATSVAEEGVDIQKCSLVIKYNYSTNEIAHVQQRGRGRADNSRCVLLTNSSALAEQERNNMIREKVMNEALDYIDSQPKCWLKLQIEEEIRRIKEEKRKKSALQKLRPRKKNHHYTLLCRKCHSLLCLSSEIVVNPTGNRYICVRRDIWTRCIRRISQYTYTKDASNSKIYCTKPACGKAWGRTVIEKGTVLPAIAADAFVLLESQGAKPLSYKKWRMILENCFEPRVLDTYDLCVMQKAPNAPYPEDDHDDGAVSAIGSL